MFFLTPPKIDDCCESPFIEVIESINQALKEEDEASSIKISNDLIKLLDGTP